MANNDSFNDATSNFEQEIDHGNKHIEDCMELNSSFEKETVEWKSISELGQIIRGNGLQKKDFVQEGVGCIHYGQIYTKFGLSTSCTLSFVDAKLAEKLTKVDPGNLVIACTSENVEDLCKSVVWLGNTTIVTGGHACVLKHKENAKYIGYCFTSSSFQSQKKKFAYGTKVLDIKKEKLGEIKIPVPSLEYQQEIVDILDTFTDAISNLEEELALREKQFEYYRSEFVDNKLYSEVKLKDVASYSKLKVNASDLNKDTYISVENLLQNKAGKIESSCCPTNGKCIKFMPKDILIGNIRPYLKKIWFSDCEGGTNGDVLDIRVQSDTLDPKYLFEVLSSDNFFRYCTQHSAGGKMPRGDKNAVMNYSFCIPPIERQQEIVEILDTFEAMIANIKEEIALRTKQYEYYREKLLSFGK